MKRDVGGVQCSLSSDRLAVLDVMNVIGPIPWGHSGPLCHALSLRQLVTGNVTAARSSEWAQHFSNASCYYE